MNTLSIIASITSIIAAIVSVIAAKKSQSIKNEVRKVQGGISISKSNISGNKGGGINIQ